MQVEKVVAYHKALADPTRIKMLILLAEGERNGQDLAEKLFVTPATITHHASKLREASLINERREKNMIYFSLNDYFLKNNAVAAMNLIYRRAEGGAEMLNEDHQRMKDSVIRNFISKEGKLKNIPSQLKKKLIVLEHMVSNLEMGRKYSEKEINEFIKAYHEDFATIRREFIMHQFLYRENDLYEMNPRELWANWSTLS
ncbi:metalloregulator ArsR/SmtB family transcription factor [Paenibacillus alvei]|uniref:Metalloregulator ArsR/SmtB family transcription factor n=1 Tax=Paenibacillus alvei TaxID=44250 RepID=A0ABT4GTN2_PAEAL|nr:metalloregulator ArsR/SmtB family transcription factor [Paenibacillus alvei]MCY7483195.1 metalloregulator ArsR/SmtB family transcription factor [Paenibacillus alvei]MCY9760060.1 metalloregulator ArsR/SmtB family transcription factor [Paenibacillus alvei]MCY9769357.1 metalloregulator ArsR/SmtB family transcription factor [Paenibacillus alvei]